MAKKRKNSKQAPHIRRSKKGKRFWAGRGKRKRIKKNYGSLITRQIKEGGEYVHDDDSGTTFYHMPGKTGAGFDGGTLDLFSDGERKIMKGPWHTTAIDMRKYGLNVYDDYEPGFWIKKGILTKKQIEDNKISRINGTLLKHFLRGESSEEDPEIATTTKGKIITASELGLEPMDNVRKAKRELKMGFRSPPIYKPELFKGEVWTKYGHGRKLFPKEERKIKEAMKIFR